MSCYGGCSVEPLELQICSTHKLNGDKHGLKQIPARFRNNEAWNATLDASVLRECGLLQGKRFHASVLKRGQGKDRFFGNFLMQMYGKHFALDDVLFVFDRISKPNVFSWTCIIGVYAAHDDVEKAMFFLRQMQMNCVDPNEHTFRMVLHTCSSPKTLSRGKFIHACISKNEINTNIFLGTELLHCYSKCESIEDAYKVFIRMPVFDVLIWTTMISAFAKNGRAKEAITLFHKGGMMPDKITFLSLLDACSGLAALTEGKLAHADILSSGFESNLILRNALISMYGTCCCIKDAESVFHRTHDQDLVSWNAIIQAYVYNGESRYALQYFRLLQMQGKSANKVTFVSVLGAAEELSDGKIIHAQIIWMQTEFDMMLTTGLVKMYGSCGDLDGARWIFDSVEERDIKLLTIIISLYVIHGRGKDSIQTFQEMQSEGVKPNKFILITVADACASLAALEIGKQVHKIIIDHGLESDIIVGTSIINMYGKCGVPKEASRVLENIHRLDIISWSSIIEMYCENGQAELAFKAFKEMQQVGIKPDSITCLSILSLCSHEALIFDGLNYFLSMSNNFDCKPGIEHFGCVIDLLGHIGCLDEAEDLVHGVPFPNSPRLRVILSNACGLHGVAEGIWRVQDVNSRLKAAEINSNNYGKTRS